MDKRITGVKLSSVFRFVFEQLRFLYRFQKFAPIYIDSGPTLRINEAEKGQKQCRDERTQEDYRTSALARRGGPKGTFAVSCFSLLQPTQHI